MTLLEVEDLAVTFPGATGDVSRGRRRLFAVDAGEIVGLVGESGCGKSVTSLAIMGLLPQPGRTGRAARSTFDGTGPAAR